MESTIIRKVKGSDMEYIFDNMSDIVNVKHYEGMNIHDDKYSPSKNYKFKILIRHSEDADAEQLFTNALNSLQTTPAYLKRQYVSQTRQYIKAEIKQIEVALMAKLDKAANSGAIPEDWAKTGNHLLQKAIVDSFCLDRPYSALDSSTKKEFSNLHKFI